MRRLERLKSLSVLPAKPTTTYGVGLLQNKAYRILKDRLADVLRPFSISPSEWGLLGLLFEAKEALHSQQIAHDLDVEAPLVTRMIHKLEESGHVQKEADAKDRRAVCISLTGKGKKFVATTEERIFDHMNALFSDAKRDDIFGYVRTLETIVQEGRG